MSLNKRIFKNEVNKHIKECKEEGKEKVKISFVNTQKIQETKEVLKNMQYYNISTHLREMHNDYVIVIHDIQIFT